jgi:hypothetical protein
MRLRWVSGCRQRTVAAARRVKPLFCTLRAGELSDHKGGAGVTIGNLSNERTEDTRAPATFGALRSNGVSLEGGKTRDWRS